MHLGQPSRARGIVLFASLALLLALGIGAMGAAQTALLESRMARNQQDAAVAFHAAESALDQAERWLLANASDPATLFAANGAGFHRDAAYHEEEPWRDPGIWRSDGSLPFGEAPEGARAPPRAVFEWLASYVDTGNPSQPLPPATIDVFRVTARGFGANAAATLQTTYARVRSGDPRNVSGRLSWTALD